MPATDPTTTDLAIPVPTGTAVWPPPEPQGRVLVVDCDGGIWGKEAGFDGRWWCYTDPDQPSLPWPEFLHPAETYTVYRPNSDPAAPGSPSPALPVASAQVLAISRWINSSPPYAGRDPELVMWRRVTKVCEEAGEVWSALSEWLGENPRKGPVGTRGHVQKELLDTAVAALAGVVHLQGNAGNVDVLAYLIGHIARMHARAGLAHPAPTDSNSSNRQPEPEGISPCP